MKRSIRIFLRLVLILLPLIAILAGLLIWRLTSEPLEIGFAKSYVEAALYDPETGNHAVMDAVYLYWPNMSDALYLGLRQGKIVDKQGEILLSVDEIALSLSKTGLIQGRLLPKIIILRKPNLRLTREENGEMGFGFGFSGDFSNKEQDQRALVSRVLEYISTPEGEARQDSPISRLKELRIENARLMIEDHILGLSWFLPDFDAAFRNRGKGLNTSLRIKLPDVDGTRSEVRAALEYAWNTKLLALGVEVDNLDTMILAGKIPALDFLRDQELVLNARLLTRLDENFMPKSLSFEANSEKGYLYHPKIVKAPVTYKNFKFSSTYEGASGHITVNQAQITLNKTTLDAQADLKQEQFSKISGQINLNVDAIKQEEIDALWPEFLRGDNSEEWIVKKMSEGTFHDLSLRTNFFSQKRDLVALENVYGPHEQIPKEWLFDIRDLVAEYAFENIRMDYRPPLTPVSQARGRGAFDFKKDTLSIDIDSAVMGEMKVSKAKILLDEVVAVGKGGADISIKLASSLKSAFEYVSLEPINMGKDLDFDIQNVQGDADLSVRLVFPTNKKVTLDDMKISADGQLTKVLLPNIVYDLNLTGGPLNLIIQDGQAQVKGNAFLDKREVSFDWKRYLKSEGKPYKAKIEAEITADPALREHLGVDLSQFLVGSVPISLVYTSHTDGKAEAVVKANIDDARLFIDPFDYEKPVGKKAKADFTAHFVKGDLVNVENLMVEAPRFSLKNTTLGFRKSGKKVNLSSGEVKRFVLDETDAALQFKIDSNQQVKIVFNGPFLDLRPFMDSEELKGEYKDPPAIISVTADRVRTAEEETISKAKFYMDIDDSGRFNQFEMDAKAGKGDIYLRFKPDAKGKRIFRMESDDAGATLKAFQVYNTMIGGKMTIYGEPIKGVFDRNFSGVAEIRDFRVVKAPAMTKLLSILSLSGMLEVLKNDGLKFSRLEVKFNWLYRKNGSLLKLKEGRTSGNTLGLTFDGEADNAKQTLNFNGTLIPLSGVNKIIGEIPLVGDILTGGTGSLFAATYSIRGKMEDPEISANPLSVLTPGIIRRILFE